MQSRAGVLFVVAAVAGLSIACTESRPVAPSGPVPTYPAPAFPALSRPGTAYRGPDALYMSNRAAEMPLVTRYVLHDDGTFALQFSSVAGFSEYRGRYTRAGSQLSFDWDAWGAGAASATLVGDDLSVKYAERMSLNDFVDGVYVREAAAR